MAVNINHGDCIAAMKQTPSKFYDIAIVDPPYYTGLEKVKNYTGKKVSSTGISRTDYDTFSNEWDVPGLELFYRIKKSF